MADFTKHGRPISPVKDAKIAEAFETGDQEKINRAFEDRFNLKPGEVLVLSEPEFVGKLPPQRMLPTPPREGPSLAEEELAEHGSIALRVPMDADDPRKNTIDSSTRLERDALVLVRGLKGGFFMAPLEKDGKGWFVRVREDWYRLDVTIDSKRNLWVVTTTV